MSDEDDFVRITLRIPKELHARLNKASAKKRSMNAEIIARLEGSFGDIDFGALAPVDKPGGIFGLLPIRGENEEVLTESDKKAARMLAQALRDYMERNGEN